jgi:hypothetical protein
MKIKIIILTILVVFLTACTGQNTTSSTTSNQEVIQPEPGLNQAEDTPEAELVQPTEEPSPEPPPVEESEEVSFAEDVFPILQSRCLTCHGGERIEGELVMLSYAELIIGGESGAVILPGDAENSLLYQLTSTGEMPKRGANLNPSQLEIILQWINAGAADN